MDAAEGTTERRVAVEDPRAGLLGFWALMATQFQGAFSDNALKWLVSFLVLESSISREQRDFLFVLVVPLVFAIPFLVFSIPGGYFADRFSKRRVTIGTKLLELLTMGAATYALWQNRLGLAAVAVRMLTSGTTGPPKRIDLSYDMLARSVMGPDPDRAPAPTQLRHGVAIVNSPLVHIGGVFRVLQCVAEARPFVLLERFELKAWAEAVRNHRPRAVSLVPAALRTVLHSDLTRADLESIRAVTCGTAPLSADEADAFTQKYGIPVLTSYAATEFGGGVAGWTLADYQKYWQAKRGSVGRANPGAQLRVVDDEGATLGPDRVGLLEVKPGQLGPSAKWMRTTDLARIDADGFVWIVGRA